MSTAGSMFELTGRVAVVTGGGGVLGASMATCLAGVGARVAVLGRTAAKLESTVAGIRAAGGEVMAVVADVLDRAALDAANARIEAEFGGVDILVHSAGGNRPGCAGCRPGSI